MLPTDRASINRKNSQNSTGPKTDAGKKRSSLNAFRHGLTGQTIVMPGEDIDAYQAFCKRAIDELKPKGLLEEIAVQTIADSNWRLNRAHAYESTLFSRAVSAHTEEIDTNQSDPHSTQAEAPLEITKSLSNLSTYEQRLSRGLEKAIQTLAQLQDVRSRLEQLPLTDAKNLFKYYNSKKITWNPADDGFVYTTAQLAAAIRRDEHSTAASNYVYREYRAAS